MWLLALYLVADSSQVFRISVAPAETLHVVQSGRGAPVVVIPGLFGSAFGFRRVTPLLVEAGYRTIVVEPLGFGSSGRPEQADYSLTAQADRVASVLDQLGVTRATVVAQSVSASIAFRLALRRPDLVAGIVSLDGGPTERLATPGFRRAMTFIPWVKWMGGTRIIRRQIRQYLVRGSQDPAWVTDQVIDGYTMGATADLDATLKAYLRMAEAREPARLAPRLASIPCPVRLLIGASVHDGTVPPGEVGLLQASLATFAVDTVSGAGAFIQEEQPARIVESVSLLAPAEVVSAVGASGGAR